jgi:Ca2+-binding RTX toxin-like protein
MKGPLRRTSRRAATIVALAAAALVAVPATALAGSSTVTYASGTVTVAGDNTSHDYTVEYDTPTTGKIRFHDSEGTVTGTSGPCAPSGSDVVCDGTSPVSSIVVNGGSANDDLETTDPTGSDVLTFNGGAGDDYLNDGIEQDTYNGGTGYDDADFSSSGRTDGVTVSADGVADDGKPGENDNIGTDVEEIDGTNQADTLTASDSVLPSCTYECTDTYGEGGDDVVNGGTGPDYVDGGSGDDVVNGNAGDDQLYGGDGNDVLDGGAGEDELFSDPGADDMYGGPDYDYVAYYYVPYVGSAPPSVNVSLDDVANDGMTDQDGSGGASVGVAAAGAPGDNVHSDVEEIDGSDGNDTLSGDAASNVIYGDDGDDTITGGGGSDFLFGDDGNDTIAARDNTADLVVCGSGTDAATTDDIDTASDCETNDVAKATLPPGPVTTVTVAPPKDTTAPKVTLGSVKSSVKRSSLLKSGVSFTLSSSEAVTYDVELTGTLHGAHVAKAGDLILATKALTSTGSKKKVTLKLTSRTKRAIGKKAKLKLTVIAVDGSGNKKTVTKTIKVK